MVPIQCIFNLLMLLQLIIQQIFLRKKKCCQRVQKSTLKFFFNLKKNLFNCLESARFVMHLGKLRFCKYSNSNHPFFLGIHLMLVPPRMLRSQLMSLRSRQMMSKVQGVNAKPKLSEFLIFRTLC